MPDPGLARLLLRWYDRERRDLPWRARRGRRPNPYHVLVSEFMLQQTQVATVEPYFRRFIERLPDLDSLASADEATVLRLWQGLGYYRRARSLLATARLIRERHAGAIPADPDALRDLPGIGRYTAGAIASIAFDVRTAIVDGNVARVLCRLQARRGDPTSPRSQKHLWDKALQLVPARRAGDFNAALMDLGATVCIPRDPRCDACPWRAACRAAQCGLQRRIPPPRRRRPSPLVRRVVCCIERDGRFLVEQRPDYGRWAGLWQFITRPAVPATLRRVARVGTFEHALSHRRYRFTAWRCEGVAEPVGASAWVRLDQLDGLALSRPQLAVAALLRQSRAARGFARPADES